MLYGEMRRDDRREYLNRRRVMIKDYQRRRNNWTVKFLPRMPDKEWKGFIEWVAAYGLPMSTRTRALRRSLGATRKRVVTHVG